ncbi:MAG: AI-2E family transporter [Anaerotignum sp.]|nr:AI-2E family transporter [Anaerotignum sp.]
MSDAKNVILNTARNFLAVFAPVFWALFFSLLFEPLVSFCQGIYEKNSSFYRRSSVQNRKVGTMMAYLIVGVVLFLICRILSRKIGDTDIQSITFQISDYIRRIGDILVLLNVKLAELGILSNVEGVLSFWTEQTVLWIEEKILSLTNVIPQIGSSFLDILIGLTAAFYFLMEKKKFLVILNDFLIVFGGSGIAGYVSAVFHEVYSVFAGYLSGQILDAVIMAVLFSGTFFIVGLPHAVFLGLLSGFSNLIPYFGAITAFILAVVSGLLSGTPMKAVYASVLILLLQQVDSIFIVPKVVGKKVELHPVGVLFSLAVFGSWFGFLGLFLAVPLGALCKKLLFWLYERKKGCL